MVTSPDSRPYLREPVALPAAAVKVFFDIEIDPMRDLCCLRGFIERTCGDNATERYVAIFTPEATPAAEEDAFAASWTYLCNRPNAVIYYSKYERTIWRKLQQKYPRVCTSADIETLFAPSRSVRRAAATRA